MRIRKRFLASVLTLAAAGVLGLTAGPGVGGGGAQRAPARPKLLVILVVDQLRTDYLTDYSAPWTGGLRRLLDEGAWFTAAAYPYLNTVTCAGHATIATGLLPARHGMVLNTWWDREISRQVSCAEDPDVAAVSYGSTARAGYSAQRLLATTLAEELHAQQGPASRAVSLSLKQRSAIMMAGRRADAVVWFEEDGWASSTAYSAQPVAFLADFLRANPVEADHGKIWNRLRARDAYRGPDRGAGEKPPEGWSETFPHELRGHDNRPGARFYNLWRRSPFSDEYLGRMARAAAEALELGRGEGTDFLAVAFSALDIAGHDFGPASHEVQDLLHRLDLTIGELIAYLDASVGRENYVVALSSDHGVAPLPEQQRRRGVSAGRISTSEVVRAVERALEPHLGPGPHVARMAHTDLYFRPGVYARLRENEEAMTAAIDAILSVQGTLRVFRSEELPAMRESEDAVARAAAASYYAGRSGDLIVVPEKFWMFTAGATTHGTLHDYDTRVPVILLGPGIRPGKYHGAASPADIAPTLAHLAGIRFEGRDGRILREALAAEGTAGALRPPAPFVLDSRQ
jgi:predicted AlkP superfamily pyrophosphatase or phosphodiesterase